MVTFGDMERVLKWARSGNRRIIIEFVAYPYKMVIHKYIRAVDAEDKFVEWRRAFGPKPPHVVLTSLKIKRIVIIGPKGKTVLKSIDDLFDLVYK